MHFEHSVIECSMQHFDLTIDSDFVLRCLHWLVVVAAADCMDIVELLAKDTVGLVDLDIEPIKMKLSF